MSLIFSKFYDQLLTKLIETLNILASLVRTLETMLKKVSLMALKLLKLPNLINFQ